VEWTRYTRTRWSGLNLFYITMQTHVTLTLQVCWGAVSTLPLPVCEPSLLHGGSHTLDVELWSILKAVFFWPPAARSLRRRRRRRRRRHEAAPCVPALWMLSRPGAATLIQDLLVSPCPNGDAPCHHHMVRPVSHMDPLVPAGSEDSFRAPPDSCQDEPHTQGLETTTWSRWEASRCPWLMRTGPAGVDVYEYGDSSSLVLCI